MRTLLLLAGVFALTLGILIQNQPHDEAAFLSDWSAPPPWPVFIALNVIAGALRAGADALTPPPIKMLDMAMGFHHTALVQLAQKFKIADALAGGPLSAAEISATIGAPSDARTKLVERVMFACAANGVFKLEPPAGDKAPRFVNTALSAVLRRDHPNSMAGMVGHNAEDVFEAWGRLEAYIKDPDTSPIPWDLANPKFPAKQGGIWKKFEALPASVEQFSRAMSSLNGLGADAMVADGPWSKFERVIDVGGGLGHLLHHILQAHPAMAGVLVDRPPVIKLAEAQWAGGGPFVGAAKRATFVGASFFDAGALPPAKTGDAYFMRYILHDWPTDQAVAILKNVRNAIGSTVGATLLIGECALPEHDTVGVPAVMYQIDIQMMVAFGEAQERTPAQWRALLFASGFELVAIHPTRSLVHWIEAKPV